MIKPPSDQPQNPRKRRPASFTIDEDNVPLRTETKPCQSLAAASAASSDGRSS
jgi:hypothetical protein